MDAVDSVGPMENKIAMLSVSQHRLIHLANYAREKTTP
jgi:hypothetical protein